MVNLLNQKFSLDIGAFSSNRVMIVSKFEEGIPTHEQITVYSKPNCMQCDFTKRFLDQHNLDTLQ